MKRGLGLGLFCFRCVKASNDRWGRIVPSMQAISAYLLEYEFGCVIEILPPVQLVT